MVKKGGGGGQKKIKLGTVDIKVTLGGEEFFSRSFPSQYFPTFKFIPLHFELKSIGFFSIYLLKPVLSHKIGAEYFLNAEN